MAHAHEEFPVYLPPSPRVKDFCAELKAISQKCDHCFSNTAGVCDIKLQLQAIYGAFDLYDLVMITRTRRGEYTVETDIAVAYKADPEQSREEWLRELGQKKAAMDQAVQRRLPEGARQLRSHEHHNWNIEPETVSFHIHAFYRTKELPDAKIMAAALAEALQPREIEKEM